MMKKIIFAIAICCMFPARPARSETIFSLIIGVNRSPDKNVPTLHYADDDAILYHKLLSTMGPSLLLVEPDDDTRRLHQDIALDTPPTWNNLKIAISDILDQVRIARARGENPYLYFIYSGHGDVKNNRGYLMLADGQFASSDLARLVLEPSRAVANHVLIDACKSYYMLQEKRAGGKRRLISQPFHDSSNLAQRFPNTGFLLSTASAANSHEWEEFQAGIFSHEVRSGLLGAADVNRDGVVSYNEIWAFVHTANSQIANERYRPTIYMRPPGGDGAKEILDTRRFRASVTVPAERAGRYFIEDSNGVRLADMHTDASLPVTLWLPQDKKLYLHDMSRSVEYIVQRKQEPGPMVLSALARHGVSYRAKGAAHEAFAKIFEMPFSVEAYQIALSEYNSLVASSASSEDIENPLVAQKAPFGAAQGRRNGLLFLAYDLRSGYLEQAGLMQGLRLGHLQSLGPIQLGGMVGYGYSAYVRRDDIAITLRELSIAAVLEHRLLSRRWARLKVGLDVGLGWGWQEGILRTGETKRLFNPLFRYQARAGLDVRLTGRLWLLAVGQLGQVVLEKGDALAAPVEGGMNLGLAIEL